MDKRHIAWWVVVGVIFVLMLLGTIGFLRWALNPPKPAPEYPVVIHIIESRGRVLAIYSENWTDSNDKSSCTGYEMIWPEPFRYQRVVRSKKAPRMQKTRDTYYQVGYWKERTTK